MALKKKNTVPKTKTAGVGDVEWGTSLQGSSAISVETIKSVDQSLSPSECYNLVVSCRRAIEARSTNTAKAKLRLFYRKSGDEIVGGPLYDLLRRPCPGYSTYSYIKELISWYDLSGEMVSLVMPGIGSRPVAGLVPLNPNKLRICSPVNPNGPEDIREWVYYWNNGAIGKYISDVILHHKNWNPLNPVRGVSPLLSGVNEISASYQATAYNRRFFVNDAIPSHLLILPPGTSPKDREAFKKEYLANHSTYAGAAHKVMVVQGGPTGIDIKTLTSDNSKDAQFQGLQKLTTSKVMELYGVPPVVGGQWDSAKFDSVDVQREVFAEETLMPLMEMVTQYLQCQLVDRFYSNIQSERSSDRPVLTKNMKAVYERAMDDRVESNVIVLLDPDTLPIFNKIKASRLDYAQNLQSTFKITPLRAAQECGFDFEENAANTKVWVKTAETSLDPEVEEVAPVEVNEAPETPVEEELDEAELQIADNYRLFYRELRKHVLGRLDDNKLFRLADADEIIKSNAGGNDEVLRAEVRKDYYALYEKFRTVTDQDAKKALVKELFNAKTRTYFKKLVRSKRTCK